MVVIYHRGSENVQSSAQVLVALSTIGIDAATDERFIAEMVRSILSNILSLLYYGGWLLRILRVIVQIAWQRQQTAYALAAYNRSYKQPNISL